MKKAVLNLFIILCLLFVPFLKNCKISVKASDNVTTWHVDDDGPANFTRIQDAIYSSLVSDGDIIYVHKGIYYENVIVNRTISLIGENKSTTIIDGSGTGNVISIIKANNVSVKGFTIRKSGTDYNGIFVDHSMGSDISDNKIIDNSVGISLSFSSSNAICGNTISNNNDGISLYLSNDNVVSSNTISSNTYYGIYLDSSGRNLISRNFILHNDLAGISLSSYSNDNIISSNTISSNNPYGISLYYSSNNTIYHNNFNNIDQVLGVYTNFWDYDSEGNYWSDYTGVDLFSGPYQNESGSDGIGDSPYVIDEINQDNRPLMGTFSDFEVVIERETYYVTIISNSTISGVRFEIGAETGNKIIRFNITGEEGSIGFSRVTIPTELMEYPHIVLVDGTELVPHLLNISDVTKFCLYFTYLNNNNTVSIISSKTLHLYYELLAKYLELQQNFYDLNETYYELLNNYTKLQKDLYSLNETYYELSAKYLELEQSFYNLNETYLLLEQGFYDLNKTYYELLDMHSELQKSLNNLNDTYNNLLSDNLELQRQLSDLNNTHHSLLINHTNLQIDLYNLNSTYNSLSDAYAILLGNYSDLLESFEAMNTSYQEHLFEFSEQMQNFRSLIYIFAAITAIFIMTTVYLSKHAHVRLITKTRDVEAEK